MDRLKTEASLRLSPRVFGQKPARTLLRVCGLLLCAFLLFHFVLMPVRVLGSSMWPTYLDGEFLLVNRLAYVKTPPQRGDVVVVKTRGDRILKRIVGLPGESFEIKKGIIHINGRPLAEEYAKRDPMKPWYERQRVLDSTEYYVVGDNRVISQFRHSRGPIAFDQIEGKLLF